MGHIPKFVLVFPLEGSKVCNFLFIKFTFRLIEHGVLIAVSSNLRMDVENPSTNKSALSPFYAPMHISGRKLAFSVSA